MVITINKNEKNKYKQNMILVLNGNNKIYKSRLFHNVGAAYIDDHPKNELTQNLLTGEHIKQGSNDARVRTVSLLSLTLIKSPK